MPRSCVFCGSTDLTNEHVLPAWIVELYTERFSGSRFAMRSSGGMQWTNLSPELKVKRVCGPCNNGWMSHLEGEVRPILEPMILGSSHHLALPVSYARTLACWAWKTGLMLELIRTERRTIDAHWYRDFFEHRAPSDHCNIRTTARYDGGQTPLEFSKRYMRVDDVRGLPRRDPLPRDYKGPLGGFVLLFSIGHALFHIVGDEGDPLPAPHPSRNWNVLWPLPRRALQWPPNAGALTTQAIADFWKNPHMLWTSLDAEP